jgi:heme exporter protein D
MLLLVALAAAEQVDRVTMTMLSLVLLTQVAEVVVEHQDLLHNLAKQAAQEL